MTENIEEKVQKYFQANIEWSAIKNPDYLYKANLDKEELLISMNDFPDYPLYTLSVNNKRVASFDNWPENWKRKV